MVPRQAEQGPRPQSTYPHPRAQAIARRDGDRWAVLERDMSMVATVMVTAWVGSLVAGAAMLGLLQR